VAGQEGERGVAEAVVETRAKAETGRHWQGTECRAGVQTVVAAPIGVICEASSLFSRLRFLRSASLFSADVLMMMMKFMFNVAAITWMMSDSRIWA